MLGRQAPCFGDTDVSLHIEFGVEMHQPRFPPADETMGQMRDRWALAVGRLLLAFGEIEHTTDACLRLFPQDDIFVSVVDLPLNKRLKLVRAILSSRQDLKKQTVGLVATLQRIEALINVRNTVAHNPLVMAFYKEADSEELRLADELPSKKGVHRFTHKQIADAAAEAESASVSMIEQFYVLSKHFASRNAAPAKTGDT